MPYPLPVYTCTGTGHAMPCAHIPCPVLDAVMAHCYCCLVGLCTLFSPFLFFHRGGVLAPAFPHGTTATPSRVAHSHLALELCDGIAPHCLPSSLQRCCHGRTRPSPSCAPLPLLCLVRAPAMANATIAMPLACLVHAPPHVTTHEHRLPCAYAAAPLPYRAPCSPRPALGRSCSALLVHPH